MRERSITQPAVGSCSSSDGEEHVQDIYKQEGEGVVFIQADGVGEGKVFGEQQNGSATGSGFLIDKQGTILTNAHVVDGADNEILGALRQRERGFGFQPGQGHQ